MAVFSCDVGVAKPEPAIYLMAVERLGATVAECVFVGDGSSDELSGAAALGMAVVRTTQFSDTDPSWAGRTITALPELLPLLVPRSADAGYGVVRRPSSAIPTRPGPGRMISALSNIPPLLRTPPIGDVT